MGKCQGFTDPYNNGSIFVYYELTGKNIGTDIYLPCPYHPWERKRNKNFNELLRQFFLEKSSFVNTEQWEAGENGQIN